MTETDTRPATDDDPITDPQLTKLAIVCDEAGLGDRDEALGWISGVLGFDIGSRKELTRKQASQLIDLLADGRSRRDDARETAVPPVQEAVRRVTYDIGQIGVGKGGWNETQRYHFRGIDQFVQSLSPILARHGVILLPDCEPPVVTEHPTSRGGTQFMVIMAVHWTIVGPAGDVLSATTIGQAMDTSDKSSNKAMSAAYKYLLGQVFAVPNMGWAADGDADHPTVDAPEPPTADDTSDLWVQIEQYALAEEMPMEQFTYKFRAQQGGISVEQLRQRPRPLLQAYLNQVERYKTGQVEAAQRAAAEQQPSPPAGYQGETVG